MQNQLYPRLNEQITNLEASGILPERQSQLAPLAQYIIAKTQRGEPVRLNFICTHNSRRSHLSQAWAQALAYHFGLTGITCYSGGTEATALFPEVLVALQAQGFETAPLAKGDNPVYAIKYAAEAAPVVGFSKEYNHFYNPANAFAAIMTCAQAEEGCPLVFGAEQRFALHYDDPKAFDGTPLQAAKYQERSLQIAAEWYAIYSQVVA